MQTLSEKCPIWGTDASEDDKNLSSDQFWFDSPRAGGKFQIDGTSKNELKHSSIAQKVALTDWLVVQRRFGNDCPKIEFHVSKDFLGIPRSTVVERMNRAILWIGSWMDSPGDKFALGKDTSLPITGVRSNAGVATFAPNFFAAIGSKELYEDGGILRLLYDAGYLRPSDGQSFNARDSLFMTSSGWQKFAELAEQEPLGSQAFVAMWFSPIMSDAYVEGFERGIAEAGYDAVRIDRKEHNNKIDDEIIAEIRRSKFVVADFTSELLNHPTSGETINVARGGVYFEAGFAKGLGKEVIWTVREDVLPFVHFDTRQFAHIVWKDTADLRNKLALRISATLGDGPRKHST